MKVQAKYMVSMSTKDSKWLEMHPTIGFKHIDWWKTTLGGENTRVVGVHFFCKRGWYRNWCWYRNR